MFTNRYNRALVALTLIAASLQVAAHESKPSIVNLDYASQSGDKKLLVEMVVNLESVIADIDPSHNNTDDAKSKAHYEQLRQLESADLQREFSSFQDTFLSSIHLTDARGARLDLTVHNIHIPAVGRAGIARDTTVTLHSMLPDEVNAVRWQWSDSFGKSIVRANSDAQTMDFATLLAPGQLTELIEFTR